MKKKGILAIFIIILLLVNFINMSVTKQVSAQEGKPVSESPQNIFQLIGKLYSGLSPIIQFIVVASAAEPAVVEIGYNETKYVELGMWDLNKDQFFYFDEEEERISVEEERFLNFEVLEYPDGNEYGKWEVSFSPKTISVDIGKILKTNVSIKLRSPRLSDKPVKSGVLKIRITDTYVFGNIWRPKEGSPFDAPIKRSIWTLLGVLGGWGSLSGTVSPEYLDVNILVKVKPAHRVKFDAVEYKVFTPDQVASIPITIENLGNYNDSYNFRVVGENKNNIKIASPTSITLSPGEKKETYLGIYIPPSVFDYGTLYNVKVQAYSVSQPNVTLGERIITLESKGVFVSDLVIIGLINIFVIAVIILFLIRTLIKRKEKKIKKQKPKKIKEEKTKINCEEIKKETKKPKREIFSIFKLNKKEKEKPKVEKEQKIEKPKEIKEQPKKQIEDDKPVIKSKEKEKPIYKDSKIFKEDLLKLKTKKLEEKEKIKQKRLNKIKKKQEKQRMNKNKLVKK